MCPHSCHCWVTGNESVILWEDSSLGKQELSRFLLQLNFLIQEEKSKLRNKFSFIERATQVLIFSSSFKDKAVCLKGLYIGHWNWYLWKPCYHQDLSGYCGHYGQFKTITLVLFTTKITIQLFYHHQHQHHCCYHQDFQTKIFDQMAAETQTEAPPVAIFSGTLLLLQLISML